MKTAPVTPSRSTVRHPIAEWALFLGAAIIGIYSIGQGLGGLFGEQGNVLWLLVTAASLIVLSAQMGRVHDFWPSRKSRASHATRADTTRVHDITRTGGHKQ